MSTQEQGGDLPRHDVGRLHGYYSASAYEHMRHESLATIGRQDLTASRYERIGGGEVIATLVTDVPLRNGDGRYPWPDVVYLGEVGAFLGHAW